MKKPFLTLEQAREIKKSYPTPFYIYDERGKYSDRYALSPLLRHQADHSISFSGQLFHPLVFPEPQKGGQTLKNLVGLDHKHHCLYRPLPPEGRHKG